MNLLNQPSSTGPVIVPKREREILELAAQGRTDKEIASELNISTETVSTYWRRIRHRYQAASRTEVVAHAMREQANQLIAQVSSENERLAEEIARRQLAENRLGESERRMRSFLSNAPLMIAAITTSGEVMFTNNEDLQARAELGDNFFSITAENSPEVAKQVQQIARDVVRDGTPKVLEVIYPGPNDRDEEFEVRIGPIPGSAPEQVIILAANITERKRAERSYGDSELQFKQVAEKVNAVLWVSDVETHKLIYLSPAYEDVWGVKVEDAMRDRMLSLDRIHPDDRHKAGISVFDNEPTEVTYRIRRPDGTIRVIWDRTFPIRDVDGKITRMAGLAEDVTALVTLSEQAQRNEELQAMVSALAQTIAVAQPAEGDKVIQFALRLAAKHFRCDRAVVVRFCPDCDTASMTHEYHAPELPSVYDMCQKLPMNLLGDVTDAFNILGALKIGSRDELTKPSIITEMMVAKGIDAVLAVPLAVEGQIHGFVAVETACDKRVWTNEEFQAMTALGQMIGSLLERKDAHTRIKNDEARRRLLLELVTKNHALRTPNALYENVFRKLREVIEYDAICIVALNGETGLLEEVNWQGDEPDFFAPREMRVKPGVGTIGEVFATGQAMMINDAHLDPRSIYPVGVQVPNENLMIVPIITEDTKRGAIVVARHAMRKPFNEADFELVQTYVAFLNLKISLFLKNGMLDVHPWNTVA